LIISGSRLKVTAGWLVISLSIIGAFFLSAVDTVVFAQTDTPNWVRSIDWSPYEDKVAFATQHGQVEIIEATSGISILSLTPSVAQTFYSLDWSPDGSKLAAGGAGHRVDIWDTTDGRLIYTLELSGEARSLAWSPDNQWLAVAGQEGVPNNVIVWDVLNRQIAFTPTIGEALAVAWSPDSATLAITKLGEIQLWDIASQTSIRSIETKEYVLSLDWNHDGTLIAGASIYVPDQPSIRIWDVSTGTLLHTFVGQQGSITYVAWDSQSSRLISASTDKSVRIWDAATGQVLENYTTYDRAFAAVFSPYGGRVAISDDIGSTGRPSVEIVVPDESLSRLQAVAVSCNVAISIQDALTMNRANQLDQIVSLIETLPADTIPDTCAADLIAVTKAVSSD
jgi:WD40 repeat protein